MRFPCPLTCPPFRSTQRMVRLCIWRTALRIILGCCRKTLNSSIILCVHCVTVKEANFKKKLKYIVNKIMNSRATQLKFVCPPSAHVALRMLLLLALSQHGMYRVSSATV